ncbi:hypothetical protein, conserved, partial [Babesia bigemina]
MVKVMKGLPTLKKLIEEAIEKAEKSLQAEKDKLECPVKYKGNESTCQFYQKKIDELKKSEKSVNSENNRNLDLYKQIVSDCKNSHSRNQDSATKKALNDIEEREKQLEDLTNKLKKFTESLAKTNNENILVNLCDGLETFLGYDKTSKGYTGQGIVYSDLDRLGDGVMGFLSSIITEVKENPNLSSYKTTLNEAVNELNKNLNKGKKGLEAVIGPVKEGIKGWLGEVEKKNNDVTKYIDVLKNDTTNAATGIEKWKNQDFDEASKKHGELHNWIKSIKELSNQPYYAIHAVEYVDEKLRNNLLPHINLLNNAIDTFKQNTVEDYDGLRTVCEKVAAKSNEIIDQANLVTKTAEKKIELMTSQLDNTITALDEHVQKAVEGLENATHELNKWSENQTDSSLHKALKQCAEVVKELDYKENKNTFYIQLAAIDAAKDVVAEVQGTLSSVNNRLMIWITKAAFLVSQSLRFVATILDELNGEDGSHNYVKQIKDAAGKLYKDALKLNGAMRAAHKHISEKVRAALEAFGEVDKAVRKDLAQFRDLIKAEVGVYFAQLGAVEYGVVKQSGDVSQLDQKVGAKFREWLRQASSTLTVITHTKIQTDL